MDDIVSMYTSTGPRVDQLTMNGLGNSAHFLDHSPCCMLPGRAGGIFFAFKRHCLYWQTSFHLRDEYACCIEEVHPDLVGQIAKPCGFPQPFE
jgi:hypothetical protein